MSVQISMTKEYHQYAKVQNLSAQYIINLIPKFLSDLPWLKTEEGPLLLVDYGCADGANSQEPVKEILKHLFDLKQKQIPVHVVHNDLPDANFSFLFSLVETSTRSYKREFGEKAPIYCLGSGKSFYEQVIASNSVSLGFSSTAFHWQRKKHLIFQSKTLCHWNASEEENQLWMKASFEEFKHLLALRGEELRVGGRFLLSQITFQPEQFRKDAALFLNLFDRVFQEVVETGRLTQEQANNCLFPFTIFSSSEIRNLFPNGVFVPEGSTFGLKLLHFEVTPRKIPMMKLLEEGKSEEYAQIYTKSMRATLSSVFVGSLPDSVDKEEIESFVFKRAEEEIAKNPNSATQAGSQTYLIMEKIEIS